MTKRNLNSKNKQVSKDAHNNQWTNPDLNKENHSHDIHKTTNNS